ncbi:alpha-aminoadipic semialdehyde synthase, mitochondrial-like isoform X2 [Gigantopelta aegis]|uniref:alpha-aminoadipic semialdehyde synthase, mitochondrial-like isoform X2 n=1 Tax=Gigantopelta aegis TaxID=1735272 RepID=UPI001B88DCE4|nr:alpha-aminoadipic semialdehyde synthase, mitochondrial-like isoform X2 [Gigantopelta aegis]
MLRQAGSRIFQRQRQQHDVVLSLFWRCMSDGPKVMAIRRETINVWERRAPLSPSQAGSLVKKGIKVLIQPSNRRAYNMQEYAEKGVIIQEDISEASLVIGVKQVPIDILIPYKTYAFFSHTIKAQEANMPLLDAILEKNIRLIDYEKMVDSEGQRVVAFGKYAGVSGMINILHGMGLRLLALGHHTPFMHIGPSHNYRNTEMARQAVREAGYEIALGRMPKSLGPLTFVFTGSGNVSQGAQEVFQELPHEYIEPEYLPKVARQGSTSKIYSCVVSREDHYINKDGSPFNANEFEEHPERYSSSFSHKIAPYASCIINGIYYAPNSPRLISIPDAKMLLRPQESPWISSSPGCPQLPHRLISICDISADPGGSIEFMKECTTIDSPFCLYDAEQNMNTESFAGSGVLICSIDNMPAQIPREATDFFGSRLLPFIPAMVESSASKPFEEYNCHHTVKNAVIASNGKLTPNFEYISELRKKSKSRHKASMQRTDIEKKALILGAGYVSSPAVEYLLRDKKVQVTVASQFGEDLNNISAICPEAECVLMDIHRSHSDLDRLVSESDVVVSLLPYNLHPTVAELCIKHKKNMVTASYVSPDMKELHKSAVDAGVTILNEVGVDPGIDHMMAMQCFDEVKQNGGKITSYVSWCGGLPAPEFSDSPLHYKFSWFPKGVLLNCLAGAKYLENGEVKEIAPGCLLDNVQSLNFMPGFNLEGFPNRDSTLYGKAYGIESAHTLLRGTLRYKGYSTAIQSLKDLNLLSSEPHPALHPGGPDITWKGFISEYFGKTDDIFEDSLKDLLYEKFKKNEHMLKTVVGLGLLGDEIIEKNGTPVDTLSNYLAKRLAYGPRERDLILMRHDIGISWPDGTTEQRQLNLVVYGDQGGHSAMAKTVGLPTGIAARMVLEGEIQTKGIVIPLAFDVYQPILSRLEQEGIVPTEKITIL